MQLSTFRSLAAAGFALLGPALGQQQATFKKVLGPIRDAGTYHVATGTWTRGGSGTATIGPDVIYRNDAPSGYFTADFRGCWVIDEVMIPGTRSPKGGPQDAYLIDGFQFAYCKEGASTLDWVQGFYDSYVPCTDPCNSDQCRRELPTQVSIEGLPGGSACWTVTVDLSGGYEVCFESDGGVCAPGYQGNALGLDHGGLGFRWRFFEGGPLGGPIIAGDPSWIPLGEGTCYDPGFSNSCGTSTATGLGTRDFFSASNHNGYTCPSGNGCYFFGGYDNKNGCASMGATPVGQFHFVLFADCNKTCVPRGDNVVYCDETTNSNNVADIGRINNDIVLTNGPPGVFCYLLIGNGMSVVQNPLGAKGALCVVGGSCLGRYIKDIQVIDICGFFSTDISNSASGGPGFGIPTCGGHIQSGETWNFQYWHRQPGGQPASFSSALSTSF